MEGLKRLVGSSKHRKELVAGGLSTYLTAGMSRPSPRKGRTDFIVEYRSLVDRLGNRASDFWSTYIDACGDPAYQPMRLLKLPLSELPQVRLQ